MGVLSPWFLLGLGALAVPVLLHLVRRVRRTPLRFPSLMFLRRFPHREKQRLRLRDPWLLLLRCLALALLVLAFTRPYWASTSQADDSTSRGRSVLIVLDNSASMRVGQRWRDAQAEARSIIDGLQSHDRAALLAFADKPQLLAPLGEDKNRLRSVVQATTPGGGTTAFAPALSRAVSLLQNESPLQSREIVLISDLQQSGLSEVMPIRLPQHIALNIYRINDAETANIGLSGLDIASTRDGEQVLLTINAQVHNYGTTDLSARIALRLEDKPRDAQSIDLPAGLSRRIQFGPIPAPQARTPAVLDLQELDQEHNRLELDDRLWFVLSPPDRRTVLVIEDSAPRAQQSLFISRALAVARQPLIDLLILRTDQLVPASLQGVDVVILNDAPAPGGEMGDALRQFILAGGGVLAAVGPASRGDWPGQLSTSEELGQTSGWLPGRLGPSVDLPAPAHLLTTAHTHPLFEQAAEGLSASQILRYRQLDSTRSDQVLAQFSTGAPALLERRLGTGRTLALALPLDTLWSDVPVQPGFVPWLINTVNYLAGYRKLPPYYSVGTVLDVQEWRRELGLDSSTTLTVRTPTEQALRIAPEQPWLHPSTPGMYWLLPPSGGSGSAALPLAVNLPSVESDLSALETSEFLTRVEREAKPESLAESEQNPAALTNEQAQSWWWYILMAVLILLALDAWLSARKAPSAATAGVSS